MKLNTKLEEYIKSERLTELFNSTDGKAFHKSIDFTHPPLEEDQYGARYQILLSAKIPSPRDEITCIFPNHTKHRRQIVRLSSYFILSSLNIDLNDGLKDSLHETAIGKQIKFSVAYGNQLYTCKGLSGTVYIVWAKRVTRISVGNVANVFALNVPLIFNCNGQGKVKAIFILKKEIQHPSELELLPMCKGNPLLMYPKKPIFVCEVRVPEIPQNILKTMSEHDALTLISAETKTNSNWLPYEENPFHNDELIEWSAKSESLQIVSITQEEELNPLEVEYEEPDPFEN